MIIPRLAIRNILGAGVRTWLNVLVLSLAFVAIIWTQGLYVGMGEQITHAMVDAEIGGGQYWHDQYDPYDPLSLPDAHAVIPESLQKMIDRKEAIPRADFPWPAWWEAMVCARFPSTSPIKPRIVPTHFLERGSRSNRSIPSSASSSFKRARSTAAAIRG